MPGDKKEPNKGLIVSLAVFGVSVAVGVGFMTAGMFLPALPVLLVVGLVGLVGAIVAGVAAGAFYVSRGGIREEGKPVSVVETANMVRGMFFSQSNQRAKKATVQAEKSPILPYAMTGGKGQSPEVASRPMGGSDAKKDSVEGGLQNTVAKGRNDDVGRSQRTL